MRLKTNQLFFTVIVLAMIGSSTAVLTAATGNINAGETHQTIEGFGASIAWYSNWVTDHPNKDDLYESIFNELGLDILRLRNEYRNNPVNFVPDISEIVQSMYYHSDNEPKVMISSWSPPAELKSNNSVNGGNNATLKKDDTTGEYVYGDFAKYWVDALNTYETIGVEADYISIQNELSYDASWESCRFDPTENAAIAGYDRALDSVYYAFQQANLSTEILGPECHGIGYQTFQSYAARYNHDHLYGYAYHLYHGGDGNVNPDAFNTNLSAIANSYSDKPIFQTEYDYGGWFNTAWLMHDCLVHGNNSGYLYWALAWPSSGNGLVTLENPGNPGSWTTDDGYILTQTYWAFRQFSKYIYAGWKRVTTNVDNTNLRISAYVNPEGDMLTVVVINVGEADEELSLNVSYFDITDGDIIRTSEIEQGEIVGSYDGSGVLDVPGRSITTLSCWGTLTGVTGRETFDPDAFTLAQNYPNPFNAATMIHFSIPKEAFVQLKVYDITGREIATLINDTMIPGKHAVYFDASNLSSGVYFYQIKAGDSDIRRKMILIQ